MLYSGALPSSATPGLANEKVVRWWNPKAGGHTHGNLLKFGATLPWPGAINITGEVAKARDTMNGFELCFQMWNALHGGIKIGGALRPVELTVLDDQSDPYMAQWAMEHMIIGRGIKHFFGPRNNLMTEASAAVAHHHGAILMAPGGDDLTIFQNRNRTFGMLPRVEQYFPNILVQLGQRSARTVAFIQEDNAWSKMACRGVRQQVNNLHTLKSILPGGAKPKQMKFAGGVTVQSSPSADSASRAKATENAVKTLQSQQPDLDVLITCGTSATFCSELLNTLNKKNYNIKAIVVTNCAGLATSTHNPLVIEIDPWGTVEQSTNTSISGWSTDTFIGEFKKHTNSVKGPSFLAASAFTSCASLLWAMENTSSTDPEVAAKRLTSMSERSILGPISFNKWWQNGGKSRMSPKYGPHGGQIETNVKAVQYAWSSDVKRKDVNSPGDLLYPKPPWITVKCKHPELFHNKPYGFVSGLDVHGLPWQACQRCGAGFIGHTEKDSQTLQSTQVCLECKPGTYYFEIAVSVDECYGEELCVEDAATPAAYCIKCDPGTFSGTKGQTACELCSQGTITNASGQSACSLCPAGTYTDRVAQRGCTDCHTNVQPGSNYEDKPGSKLCKECPKGAACKPDALGKYTDFINADGYWVMPLKKGPVNASALYICGHGDGEACLEDSKCFRDPDTGEPSMEGTMCSRCRKGYGRASPNHLCYKCPSTLVALTWNFIVILQVSLAGTLMVYSMLSTDQGRPKRLLTVILKQVFNYMSVCSVVFQTVKLDLPVVGELMPKVFKVGQSIFGSGSPETLQIGVDCLVRDFFPSHSTYYVYIWLGVMWIPMWELSLVATYFVFKKVMILTKKTPPRFENLVSTMVIFAFVLHPRANELILSPFRCFYADEARLRYDLSILCDSDEHRRARFQSVVAFVLISLGIPFFLFMVLRHYRNNEMLGDRRVQDMFGFMYNGFAPDSFYFECVFMVRKLAYQVMLLMPGLAAADQGEDKAIMCCTLSILAVSFLALHLNTKPFDNRNFFILDKIESAALWSVFITVFCQTWLWITDRSYAFTDEADNKNRRNIRFLVTCIILLGAHARFWFLVLKGCFAGPFAQMMFRGYCGFCAKRLISAEGEVEVKEHGLVFWNCNRAEEAYFMTTVTEVIESIFEDGALESSEFTYEVFVAAIQQIVVRSGHKRERKHLELNFMHNLNRVGKGLAKLLSFGKKHDTKQHRQSMAEMESNQAFHEDHLSMTYNTSFSVGDLHAAMMECRADFTSYPRALHWEKLGVAQIAPAEQDDEASDDAPHIVLEKSKESEACIARENSRANREEERANCEEERANKNALIAKDLRSKLDVALERVKCLEKESWRTQALNTSRPDASENTPSGLVLHIGAGLGENATMLGPSSDENAELLGTSWMPKPSLQKLADLLASGSGAVQAEDADLAAEATEMAMLRETADQRKAVATILSLERQLAGIRDDLRHQQELSQTLQLQNQLLGRQIVAESPKVEQEMAEMLGLPPLPAMPAVGPGDLPTLGPPPPPTLPPTPPPPPTTPMMMTTTMMMTTPMLKAESGPGDGEVLPEVPSHAWTQKGVDALKSQEGSYDEYEQPFAGSCVADDILEKRAFFIEQGYIEPRIITSM